MSHADFWRLTHDLRAIRIDFDYAKTRRLLDPRWDGYNIGDMDIIDDDAHLKDANLVTSQHRDNPELHRVVLDLDYGVVLDPYAPMFPNTQGHLLIFTLNNPRHSEIQRELTGILTETIGYKAEVWMKDGILQVRTKNDLALVPSSTPGHHHLILDANLPWPVYKKLLNMLSLCGVIEFGYAQASMRKGYSAIRPPWVKK